MTFDRFSGDPKLILTEDGADMQFVGGQPLMDRGLENLAMISLFTQKGWAGNYLIDAKDEKAGSDFEVTAKKSITLTTLNDVRQMAESALKNPAFGKTDISVVNPNSNFLQVHIVIHPPGSDLQTLILAKNGANWINQKLHPANERIK